ncbi:hypothetical protein J1N35_012249 [Gossypium stocksii]|uniref:Uncharacterized protein n=1 Tax=Gossypium stocksii TaxID=47602 RepID=A0A9D4AEB9_9ROSI|nr:hypothetical protein J1N35_012249 [Gossypium stocksii]
MDMSKLIYNIKYNMSKFIINIECVKQTTVVRLQHGSKHHGTNSSKCQGKMKDLDHFSAKMPRHEYSSPRWWWEADGHEGESNNQHHEEPGEVQTVPFFYFRADDFPHLRSDQRRSASGWFLSRKEGSESGGNIEMKIVL